MDPALLLAMIQALRLGMDVVADLQAGDVTPEEAKARWDEVVRRTRDANAMWEAAGTTAAAREAEGRG